MYCWGILFATVKLFFYLYNWSALSIDRCKHVSIYVLCHGFTLSLTLFLSSVCDLNCTGAKLSCCITYHMFEEMSDLKSALHERIRRGGRPSVFLQDQPRQHTLHSAICICKLSILCSDAFCVKRWFPVLFSICDYLQFNLKHVTPSEVNHGHHSRSDNIYDVCECVITLLVYCDTMSRL